MYSQRDNIILKLSKLRSKVCFAAYKSTTYKVNESDGWLTASFR